MNCETVKNRKSLWEDTSEDSLMHKQINKQRESEKKRKKTPTQDVQHKIVKY